MHYCVFFGEALSILGYTLDSNAAPAKGYGTPGVEQQRAMMSAQPRPRSRDDGRPSSAQQSPRADENVRRTIRRVPASIVDSPINLTRSHAGKGEENDHAKPLSSRSIPLNRRQSLDRESMCPL